jgi:two-component system cell cycle sensor histidine kinase/response regulator CckA
VQDEAMGIPRPLLHFLQTLLIATAYFLLGHWSLQLYALGGFAAPIWIPAGIALAAVFLMGRRMALAVAIGAFLVNHRHGANTLTAAGFAAGNALEAVLGASLLRLFSLRPTFERLRDVFLLAGVGLVAAMAGAICGACVMVSAGVLPLSEYLNAWRVWASGDFLSCLIVTPLLLIWAQIAAPRIHPLPVKRLLEALLLIVTMVVATDLVFGRTFNPYYSQMALPYLIFPPLIWAGVRYGPRGAVLAVFHVALMAVMRTASALGPFGTRPLATTLLSLQLFLLVVSLTALIFAALAAERAAMREASRTSDLRFRTLIENSSDGIVLVSLEGVLRYVAPTRHQVLGYPQSQLVGRSVFELIHPDDQGHVQQIFSEILRDPAKVLTLQARVLHLDGSWHWIEATCANALKDPVMKSIVVNFHDITEMKTVEAALRGSHEDLERNVEKRTRELSQSNALLRESEERFRLLVDGVQEYAIYGLDPEGQVVTWNAGAERFNGYASDEIIGQSFTRFYTTDDIRAGKPAELLRRATIEGRVREEGWRVRKDGTRYFAEIMITALRDKEGNPKGFAKITRDITDRRRMDERLRRSQEQLSEAQRIAHLGSWDWDIAKNRMSWSDELYRIHGLPPQGFRILYGDVIRYVHPDDRKRVKDAIRHALKSGEFPPIEYRIVRANRSERTLRAYGKVIGTTPGYPVRIVGTAQDITELKQAERDLQQKEEELFQARKLEAIGRLAGGVAHDFNNLITGILGISQDLKNTFPMDDPRRDELEEVIKASNRAFEVTRQLLAFGRRQIMSPKIIDVNATIRDFVKLLHRLIGEDIRLEMRLSESSWVKMDPGNLGQVLLNLALNARDAMPSGGTISLRTSNELAVPAKGGPAIAHVVLELLDTGKGMDPATLSHIFEPFFTTKSKDKGTGLGLATVYGIIMQSEGQIFVDSEMGKGTRFRILLPCAASSEELEPAVRRPAPASQGHEKILVIEDEDIVRRVVVKRLAAAGYAVLEARDGREALGLVQEHGQSIDLVISDVVMPEMNGRDVINKIRALHPEVGVLFMSGYPEEIIAHRGTLEPGINFLEKALIQRDLLKKVREVLGKAPWEGVISA